MPTSPKPTALRISGTVYDAFDTPLPGVRVQALHKHLRTEVALGNAQADAQGHYTTTLKRPAGNKTGALNVLVRVTGKRGKVLAESAVQYKLVQDAVVDVKVGGGAVRVRNEYDALLEQVQAVLKEARLKLAGLSEEKGDIAHVAALVQVPTDRIRHLVQAHAEAKGSGLEPAIHYALLRSAAGSEVGASVQWPAQHVRKVVREAMAGNIISRRFDTELDKVIAAYDATSVRDALRTGTATRKLLDLALTPAQQKEFLAVLTAHEDKPAAIWDALKLRPAFRNAKLLAKTQELLEIHASTSGCVELTGHLVAQRTSAGVAEFAKYDRADWEVAIKKARVAKVPEQFDNGNAEESKQRYAEALYRIYALQYPGAHFAYRITREAAAAFKSGGALQKFLLANPSLDLRAKNIDAELESADFGNNNPANKANLKEDARALHRLQKLVPEANGAIALHAKGIRSAGQLVKDFGKETFVTAFASALGGAAAARAAYGAAASVSNKSLAMAVAARTSRDISMRVMESASSAAYHEMFGDFSLCPCEHCTSVYSPAAYLVDVLAFIQEHSERLEDDNYNGPYGELMNRRPDLAHILLTCTNTNTVLPYIDLVNEILQREVVRIAELSGGRIPDRKSSFQTVGMSAMLLARPEHEIPEALAEIGKSDAAIARNYVLPYAPYLDELRSYISKLGTTRAEVMTSLASPGANDVWIAAEELNLSRSTMQAIVSEATWAFTFEELPVSVKEVLDHLRITYEELLRLLELEHLNPIAVGDRRTVWIDDTIPVDGLDGEVVTCDLSKMKVMGHDEPWMRSVARAIRLWKTLKWDLVDLDCCIIGLNLQFGTEVEGFLQGMVLPLHRVQVVAQRLWLSVQEAVALVAPMDVRDRMDGITGKTIPSLFTKVFGSEGGALIGSNMQERKSVICAALRITDQEFMLLQPADATVSVQSLARLWRKVTLMKALRMEAEALVAAMNLVEHQPDNDGVWALADLLSALDELDLLRDAKVDIRKFFEAFDEKIGSHATMPVTTEEDKQMLAVSPRLLLHLKFGMDEVSWIYERKIELDIEAAFKVHTPIDMRTDETSRAQYVAFGTLFRLKRMKEALGAAWMDVLGSESKAKWMEPIQEAIPTTGAYLPLICGDPASAETGLMGLSYPADLRKPENVLRVLDAMSLMHKLGCNNEQLLAIIDIEPEPTDPSYAATMSDRVSQVAALVRAKFSEAQWLEIERAVQDDVRVRRRDALVAWVLARNDKKWRTINDLHAALLIDVEMSACTLTSRIKQAISSVQLFVDRCLMGLEPVSLNKDFADQWNRWRKQYRVWEANRKVFLYPENWIEPDLRKDKSPFFQELEAEISQNDLTDELAEKALITYLEKLDAVANLEIVALHEDKATKKLHVIGRTRNHPHRYFYRYRQLKVWSAWEKLDVDVEGDHLLLTVWNGRMLLFWGQFTEKQYTGGKTTLKGSSSEMSLTSDEPKTYVEMKLAWSEYASGKWGAKKMSKQASELNAISKYWLPTPMVMFRDQSPVPANPTDNDGRDLGPGDHGSSPVPSAVESNRYVSRHDCFLVAESSSGRLTIKVLQSDVLAPGRLYHRYRYTFDNCNGVPVHADSTSGAFLATIGTPSDNLLDLDANGSFSLLGRSAFSGHMQTPRRPLLERVPSAYSISPERQRPDGSGNKPLYQTGDGATYLVESSSPFDAMFDPQWDDRPAEVLHMARLAPGVAVINDRVSNGILDMGNWTEGTPAIKRYRFTYQTHFHPYTCRYLNAIRGKGIDALYDPELQHLRANDFAAEFSPTDLVAMPYPVKEVDFAYQGAYAQYNWELFFHIPLLIATRLQADKKFAEARRWYHRIFDPTRSVESGAGAERFWITKPFKEAIQLDLANLQELLTEPSRRDELNAQLTVWETNPFDPHAVARLRHTAYMRTTVLKYIDNLIEWGDQLFRRDTIESINEAILLYILAANILGERQESIPSTKRPTAVFFDTVDEVLDPFNNFLAAVEGFIDPPEEGANPIRMQGFCLPGNPDILRYWDTVADRLFKVRHCMNIDGVVRQLPLFEPPIDPGLLVRATNQGLSLDQILSGQDVALPHYRFRVMLQRANELCNEVKSLGSMLLSTLEKKDAEELSLLRSTHELRMLDLMRDIKVRQRDEAKEQLKAVMASRKAAEHREEFYTSREYLNSTEQRYFQLSNTANTINGLVQANAAVAALSYFIPEIKIGSGFTIGATHGGLNLGNALDAWNHGYDSLIGALRTGADMANTKATYQRRQEDWDFQADSARKDIAQIDKQITATEIRLAIAEKELENHAVQMEQSAAVDAYMRGKFTNQELYHWMAGNLSTLYFQTYDMALRAAKQAEQCMLHELPDTSGGIVRAGQWDGLKKGLMSGDELQYDLRRLESEYTERDARDLELTKHISLAQLDPFALIKLRETGTCEFETPEVLYDLDFPGHFRRRIRSVSISIPCVAGPYTSVSATLTQVSSRYRKTGELGSEFQETAFAATPSRAIATSHGQNDAGLFELNFRDERYLPFEGTGAIGRWKLELPEVARQFDYGTISDMLLHVRYTARSSDVLKAKVNEALRAGQEALVRSLALADEGPGVAVNLRRDMPSEWHRLKWEGSVQLTFGREQLPYVLNSLPGVSFGEVVFVMRGALSPASMQLTASGTIAVVPMEAVGAAGSEAVHVGRSDRIRLTEPFTIIMDPNSLPELEDLIFVLKYAFQPVT